MPKKKPYDGQFTQRGLIHKNENEGGDSHTHPTENIKEELLCLLGIVYAKMIKDADGESDESDESDDANDEQKEKKEGLAKELMNDQFFLKKFGNEFGNARNVHTVKMELYTTECIKYLRTVIHDIPILHDNIYWWVPN